MALIVSWLGATDDRQKLEGDKKIARLGSRLCQWYSADHIPNRNALEEILVV